MPAPEDFARAAEALAGARFRLHGRDRSTGLDCVGLVGLALADIGMPVQFPAGYRLRNAAITGGGDLPPIVPQVCFLLFFLRFVFLLKVFFDFLQKCRFCLSKIAIFA